MLNDLFRTYKKIIILVLVLLSCCIFWFYGCHRQKAGQTKLQKWEKISLIDESGNGYRFETDSLQGTVVFGTQGYLVADKTLPVTMSLNCMEDTFTGILKITLPDEDGKGVAYQAAVNCKKGITSRIVMDVPQLGNAAYFCFELLDQFGSSEFSQMVVPEAASAKGDENAGELSGDILYIGVFSDQYEALSYLEGMTLNEQTEDGYNDAKIIRLIRFSADSFPSSVEQLGVLSGILIDSFDTSSLSQVQMDCLDTWVREEGGRLIISTGLYADAVLSGLEEKFGVAPGDIDWIRMNFYDEYSSVGGVTFRTCDLAFADKNGWETNSFSSPAGIYTKKNEKGYVNVLNFSLIDDFLLQWTGRDEVVQSVLQNLLKVNSGDFHVDDTSLWYIKRALYAFFNSQLPNTFYYGAFFIVYLSALGAFAYYLLRRMKKREYIWGVVPVIAIAFTICLFVRNRGIAGGNGSSFSAVRVIDTENSQDEVYFLYQNDEGENCNINLVPEVTEVEPLGYDYETVGRDAGTLPRISQSYTVNNTKNGFDIVFEESVPGTCQMLKCSMEQNSDEYNTSCFEENITGDYTSFKGEIKNISSYDFDKVVLIRGHQYEIVDGVVAGQTVRIEDENVKYWSGYEEENEVFGGGDEMSVSGNLMEYLQQQYIFGNNDIDKLLIIGITDDNDFKLFSDDNILKNHLTVFVNRFSLEADEVVDYTTDINGSYLENGEQGTSLKYGILEANETKAVYSFDSETMVWALVRNRDNFEGSIYAYNYDTQENDEILSEWDDCMYCEALEPYLSDMNRMILIYSMAEGNNYGGAPVLSLLTKD